MKKKIVLISGKQGSGKTTLANELKKNLVFRKALNITSVKFAGIIYAIHNYAVETMESLGFSSNHKHGDLLQFLGTEWGRKNFGDDVWVKATRSRIDALETPIVIIDDCRFENEFDGFPEALRVRLECPEEIRKIRCDSWRDATNHPSEISLDNYVKNGKFDLIFYTDKQSTDHCVEIIMAKLDKNNWIEKRFEGES